MQFSTPYPQFINRNPLLFMASRSKHIIYEDKNDLGFGGKVSRGAKKRFLNTDGSFNVERINLPFWQSSSLYHWFLTMTWPQFYAVVGVLYLVGNIIFAALYYLSGSTFQGVGVEAPLERFWEYFFFSVQTFTTIGYGRVNPDGATANVIAAVEALFGVLSIAVGTGLLFARFSRPSAKIMFSQKAVIAPFRDGRGLKIRLMNLRRNQLINVSATLIMTRIVRREDGGVIRKWEQLPLDRPNVMFFPLSWTIVHIIDQHSPLHGETAETLAAADVEMLLLVTAIEEHFSATVHARTSYKFHEIECNADFEDMYLPEASDGVVRVDAAKLHSTLPEGNL